MGKGKTYSDKLMLDKLRTVVIKNWGSKYHLSKPSWEAYQYRMAREEGFAVKVNEILTEAEYLWHKKGMDMMSSTLTTSAQMNFFKYLTASKRSFLSYEDTVLADQLDKMEADNES